jgi:hypothetical protein
VLPDGKLDGLARDKEGEPIPAAWQTTPFITQAIEALEANGDREKIENILPDTHKVRSFYNNILDPHSPNEDATIDTHMVGAALLRQIGSSSAPVLHNFGLNPTKVEIPGFEKTTGYSAVTGVLGNYGLYAQATRELAHEIGIEPRQLQSIIWETKRTLFGDLNKKQIGAIEHLWQQYHDNKHITLEETQRKIGDIAGGFDKSLASLVLRMVTFKGFDPDEPRDEEGRWTDGGSSGVSGGGESAPVVPNRYDFEPKWSEVKDDAAARRMQEAIESWVGPNNVLINGALRDPKRRMAEDQSDTIKALDETFQYAKATSQDYRVYRGMGVTHQPLNVGTVFQDRGFVSTAPNQKTAEDFAEDHSGYVVEITIPKGTKIIAPIVSPENDQRVQVLDEDEEPEDNEISGEPELLLNRGSKFVITGKREAGAHQTIFEARLVV